MSNSIKNLLYDAGGNLSRPANFTIEFTFPNNLAPQIFANQYDILCKTFSIPESETKNNDITFKGSTIHTISRVDYIRTLNITLLLDEDHKILRDLITWQKGLDLNTLTPNNDIKIMQSESKDNLFGAINIISKNWQGGSTARYTFDRVFPTKIGSIELDSSSTSGFLEVQVEFAFLIMQKDDDFLESNKGLAETLVDNTVGTVSSAINSDISKTLDQTGINSNLNNNIIANKKEIIKKYSNFLNKEF